MCLLNFGLSVFYNFLLVSQKVEIDSPLFWIIIFLSSFHLALLNKELIAGVTHVEDLLYIKRIYGLLKTRRENKKPLLLLSVFEFLFHWAQIITLYQLCINWFLNTITFFPIILFFVFQIMRILFYGIYVKKDIV